MDSMTILSKAIFDQSKKAETVEEAMQILLSYEHFRTLGDVLRKFSSASDLKQILVEGLLRWNPQDNPDSTDRKVRNWLNGKTQSVSKSDAYILCRVLGLSLDQSDAFLQHAAGEGIHWRNPEDIVWCYSIVHDYSPEDTRRLMEQVTAFLDSLSTGTAKNPDSYTEMVHNKLITVLPSSEKALFAFLEEEYANLGTLHNTAYQLFTQYMSLLKQGYSELGTEALFDEMTREDRKNARELADGDVGIRRPEAIAVRDILEAYMYRKLVPIQTRGKAKSAETFSAIQKNIRQNWPDEASLSRMESRKLDVSRKVLILLFLATDGTDSDYEEFDLLESPDDLFESLYIRMDTMLEACGFPQLDPRNPFDWIILFCIATGDLCNTDERLQELLMQMYPSVS